MSTGARERLDAIFGALADPTRRALVERLARHGPASATELARDLPISRQAVVKHLQALEAAGLVHTERCGREVRFATHAAPLAIAKEWMDLVERGWDRRLRRLETRSARRD